MPSFCCVPGCSSDGTFQKGLAFHEFPTEKSLRKSWIHAIRRDVGPHFQIVRGSTKVCSLHFREEDYRKPCARTLARRKQKQKDRADRMESSSHRHILAPGVVPSVFPSFPERPAKRARPPPRERPQPAVAPADFTNDEDSESTDMVDTKQLGDDMDTIQGASAFSVESDLAAQVAALQEQLQAVLMRNQELEEHVFSAERILEDTSLLQFYTGFQSKAMFLACFNFLKRSALSMRMWRGQSSNLDGDRVGAKTGPPSKLNILSQFFFTCVRLRRGYPLVDLADRMKVSPSTLSRVFVTWINLMYVKFRELLVFPSRRKIVKNMPSCFKMLYPSTRIIIDCTEFFIQRPSSLEIQSASFSAYKNHNTCKLLVGISPDGAFTFISDLYEGSISDRDLVIASGLLDKLERGDSVMADKGFEIEDLLLPLGVRLNIPPFLHKGQQMLPDDVRSTKSIAAVRIHVERAIGRLKQNSLLDGVIDNSLFDILDRVVFAAAMLCNFLPSLAA